MASYVRIQRKRDKFLYTIEGDWEESQVINIINKIEFINTPFIVKYTKFEYKDNIYYVFDMMDFINTFTEELKIKFA